MHFFSVTRTLMYLQEMSILNIIVQDMLFNFKTTYFVLLLILE